MEHYLTRLAELGCKITDRRSWAVDPTGEQALSRTSLVLPGGEQAVLSVAPPPNKHYAESNSYIATLTLSEGDPAESPVTLQVMRQLELLPLTDYEIEEVRRQFPLTQEFAAKCGKEALAGYAYFLAIHHMTDFVGMMDALVAMGVDPRNVTILDKGYPYTKRHRVDGYLRDKLGLRVFTYPERSAGIKDHLEMAKSRNLKTLVFDDGGHVLPIILTEYPEDASQIIGLVEQTVSGIWKLEGLSVPVPVFSVAESQLKAALESYGVAEAGVRSVLSLLPEEKFEGQAALVIGYGRIGRQVAAILRSRRMRVAVHDRSTVQLVTAHEEGFQTSRSLSRLIADHQPLLIVGTAGRNSLTREHLSSFRKSCYLASITSRTFEFNQEDLRSGAQQVLDYGRLGHGYVLDNGTEICLLGHGMPINFYHASSLANRYIDLIVAALLLGGVTLAARGQGGFRPGHNVDLTNKILNSSSILDIYYDWYGEPTARRELLSPRPQTGLTRYEAPPWTFDNHSMADGTR